MGFIKFTGLFLNDEFNSFFREFGYTQLIEITTPPDMRTANQFAAEFLRYYTTADRVVGYGTNRRTIPAKNISVYEPLKIMNLWYVWADIQEKPVEKQKFYLMDNKLLFFWVPRTKQDYVFRSSDQANRRGQAQFGKSAGGWFCLHRSPIADEEGNFPLKFGLPVEYKILGIMARQGNMYDAPTQILKEDEFAEAESFKGIAYNWDFQGGILYRTYGQAGREAAVGSRTRILANLDWYACISRRSSSSFTPVKFQYPRVISRGLRRGRPETRLSSINDKLKRSKQSNNYYIGREFTATCVTERNLKSLMTDLENQEFQVTYSLPTSSYQSEAIFHPLSIGQTLLNAGLSSSLSTSGGGRGNRRTRETVEGMNPIGFTTKITFDSESCLPLFSGRTEREWKRQITPQPSPLTHDYGNIINYNYRIPQILR